MLEEEKLQEFRELLAIIEKERSDAHAAVKLQKLAEYEEKVRIEKSSPFIEVMITKEDGSLEKVWVKPGKSSKEKTRGH